MDTTVPDIEFDENGTCNYCKAYEIRAENELLKGEKRDIKLKEIVEKIKKHGKNKQYDSLIGISGGVDSTYVAYIVKKLSLRPLAIHLDNGWDAELAVKNIENVLHKLDIDLFTHVIDWEEFKDLQLSFIKSSIASIENPTDHAIRASLYNIAAKNEIKYVISGGNIVTEAIMPDSWMDNASDLKLIKSIQKQFGSKKLKTFPIMSIKKFAYYTLVKKIKYLPILNYLDYNKKQAKEILVKELDWVDYGGKHYESIFTRFFQGYILPIKFNMDKRIPHLSTLIMSKQIIREEALDEIKNSTYPSQELLEEDYDYFLKKLELSKEEFEIIMQEPPKSAKDYPSSLWVFKKLRFLEKLGRKIAKRV